MNSRRVRSLASVFVILIPVPVVGASLVACGARDEDAAAKATVTAKAKEGAAKSPAEKPLDAHPVWFVGRWVFDPAASERRLDALGVAKDAKPGDEGMTRSLLTAWSATGLEYLLGADGQLSQVAQRVPTPDARYRWKAVGPDEIEFAPTPGSDLFVQGFRPQRLRRVGEGLESYNPRLPIRTSGGEFRYLYRRATATK